MMGLFSLTCFIHCAKIFAEASENELSNQKVALCKNGLIEGEHVEKCLYNNSKHPDFYDHYSVIWQRIDESGSILPLTGYGCTIKNTLPTSTLTLNLTKVFNQDTYQIDDFEMEQFVLEPHQAFKINFVDESPEKTVRQIQFSTPKFSIKGLQEFILECDKI